VQAGWDDCAPLHIAMLIGIDRATEENGCLEIAAGRRREGMLGERWLPLKEKGSMGYQAIPTEPGDVLFFDSYVPHRSQPNRTSEQRRVL
jgi:ectoine hydroxylase-related dioxygenase (phytanoyl-CoA dioxygenase family)